MIAVQRRVRVRATGWDELANGLHGKGQMGKVMRALGLMSGTSLDGIDVALLDTDGRNHVVRGPSMTVPYDAEMRQMLVVSHRGRAAADTTAMRRPGVPGRRRT